MSTARSTAVELLSNILARVAELEEEMRLKDAELQHQHDMAAAAAASAASNKASSSADN